MYPKFKLNELSFEIDSVNSSNQPATIARYSGKENLIKLSVANVKHDLIDPTTGETDLVVKNLIWNKVIGGVSNLISENEYIFLDEVSETGVYQCVLTYEYKYQGYSYTVSDTQNINITITKAPLYVIVKPVETVYGTYLTQGDIDYSISGLLWQDKLNKYTVEYPHEGDIQAKVYPDAIKVKIDSIHDGNVEKISNYDVLYSHGEYTVKPKKINFVFTKEREFTYGEEIVIQDTYIDTGVYNGNYDNPMFITLIKKQCQQN